MTPCYKFPHSHKHICKGLSSFILTRHTVTPSNTTTLLSAHLSKLPATSLLEWILRFLEDEWLQPSHDMHIRLIFTSFRYIFMDYFLYDISMSFREAYTELTWPVSLQALTTGILRRTYLISLSIKHKQPKRLSPCHSTRLLRPHIALLLRFHIFALWGCLIDLLSDIVFERRRELCAPYRKWW